MVTCGMQSQPIFGELEVFRGLGCSGVTNAALRQHIHYLIAVCTIRISHTASYCAVLSLDIFSVLNDLSDDLICLELFKKWVIQRVNCDLMSRANIKLLASDSFILP